MSIFNGYYDNSIDNFFTVSRHILEQIKSLNCTERNSIIIPLHFASWNDYTSFRRDVKRSKLSNDTWKSYNVEEQDVTDNSNKSPWHYKLAVVIDDKKELVYDCTGILTNEERLNYKYTNLLLQYKSCKSVAVKEFVETLKTKLSKFVYGHSIPECIFNDVIDDLLKEYSNES